MARSRATISLDREKAAKAARLLDSKSTSDVVDIALDRLIQVEKLRHDLAVYTRQPPNDVELRLTDLPVALDLADEHLDYEALYLTEH